jgi:hypothetical protein
MDDLRERLRSLGGRVTDDPDALERLRAVRDLRTRWRRLLSGTLAFVVAAAGSYVAYSAFRERNAMPSVASTTPSSVPDLAVVECDGRDLTIHVGTVTARLDGAHVQVINTSDRTLAFNASDTDEFHDVPPGSSTFVESFFFGPGWHYVACGPAGRLADAFMQKILVVDPTHAWSSTELACPGAQQWGRSDPSTEGEDPIEVARDAMDDPSAAPDERVRESDELRFAGYPESPSRRVVVLVRDGRPIEEVWLKAHDGGWTVTLINGCP